MDAEDPTRVDILVTITADVPADNAITKIGTQEIREGRDHTIKTRYIEHIATIGRSLTQTNRMMRNDRGDFKKQLSV